MWFGCAAEQEVLLGLALSGPYFAQKLSSFVIFIKKNFSDTAESICSYNMQLFFFIEALIPNIMVLMYYVYICV